MSGGMEAAAAREKAANNGITHYAGCWRIHRECAVTEVIRLRSLLSAVVEDASATREKRTWPIRAALYKRIKEVLGE